MRVCRQVRNEAHTVANRDTFKRLRMRSVRRQETDHPRIEPISGIGPFITAMSSLTPGSGFLRKIQLKMSATSYFAFIDIYPTHASSLAHSKSSPLRLDALKTFRGLKHVDFWFISRKHMDALCPWALLEVTDTQGEHSCQRTWIDWFFTLAWARLRALSASRSVRYTLSGSVKTSRKQYWEHALNKGDNMGAMMAEAVKALKEKRRGDITPASCSCRAPCSRANNTGSFQMWDAEDIRRIQGSQEHIDDTYWSFED